MNEAGNKVMDRWLVVLLKIRSYKAYSVVLGQMVDNHAYNGLH